MSSACPGVDTAGRERGENDKDTELSTEQLQHSKTGRVESSQSKLRDSGENAVSRDPGRHSVPAAQILALAKGLPHT